MKDTELRNLINLYRSKTITGYFVDLVPATKRFAKEIIELRNSDRAKYFFNQNQDLTLESQIAWFDRYFSREDDLYWCLVDKSGDFLGTYRVYNIDFDNRNAEVGSVVIKESRAKARPYFLEASVLVYDLIFKSFRINSLIAITRIDNYKTRSFNNHMGAEETVVRSLDNVEYIETIVTPHTYKRNELIEILNYWIKREEKLAKASNK